MLYLWLYGILSSYSPVILFVPSTQYLHDCITCQLASSVDQPFKGTVKDYMWGSREDLQKSITGNCDITDVSILHCHSWIINRMQTSNWNSYKSKEQLEHSIYGRSFPEAIWKPSFGLDAFHRSSYKETAHECRLSIEYLTNFDLPSSIPEHRLSKPTLLFMSIPHVLGFCLVSTFVRAYGFHISHFHYLLS
jgi:hypothetical protein